MNWLHTGQQPRKIQGALHVVGEAIEDFFAPAAMIKRPGSGQARPAQEGGTCRRILKKSV